MDTELAYSILEIMQTMEDAAKEMKLKYIAGDIQGFNSLSMGFNGMEYLQSGMWRGRMCRTEAESV